VELSRRVQANGGPVLVWSGSAPVRALSTCVLGGGIGDRSWLLNAEVPSEYHHDDPRAHAAEIAADLGLPADEGIGFLTAARVLEVRSADDSGARCDATVGLTRPTWAAAPEDASAWQPGTINLVCWVPAALDDAALANALATATEAKAQALFEAGVAGTGTASDAVAVCCPRGGGERYGGPRSSWGGRLARAVHRAVLDGIGS
jgi:adenosylcobinamide amidohydrolase